jgi:hypothetical protein
VGNGARATILLFGFALVATQGCGGTLPNAQRAGIEYASVPSRWPADRECINQQRGAIVAKEVLMGRTRTVVVAGGPSPISDEDWVTFTPGMFNRKNSDRHTLFTRSCFARSPSAPADCVGDRCRRVLENEGHSWVELSKIEAVDCTPAEGGCDPAHVRRGQLAIVVTRKCHEMVFGGRVFLLRGPHGEEAVMHATANGVPTTDVALPQGWQLREETPSEPLVLHPFGGGDACFYNILRDEKTQSYHQFRYAGPTYPSSSTLGKAAPR